MSATFTAFPVTVLAGIGHVITRNRRNRHNDFDSALRRAERNAERMIEENRRHMMEEFDMAVDYLSDEMAEMDRNHREAMADLSDRVYKDLAHQRQEFNRQMAESDRRHREDMGRLEDSIHKDMAKQKQELVDRIETRSRELHDRINNVTRVMEQNFKEQRQQIQRVNQRVNTLFERIAQEEGRMQEVVDSTVKLFDAVSNRTPVEVFTPTQYQRISARLRDLAQSNDPAASKIAVSRELCYKIWEMEEDAILAKARHDELYYLADSRLSAVMESAEANRRFPVEANDEESYDLETDFWTRGEYLKTINELSTLRSELGSDPDRIPDSRLDEICEQISELETKTIGLVEEAIRRSFLSRRRLEMSVDIVQALQNQGWQIKYEDGKADINYLGGETENDIRESVYSILRGPEDEELTIIVGPNADETENLITFHRNDDRILSPQQYERSLEDIRKEIEQSGYVLSQGKCCNKDKDDSPIPEMRSPRFLDGKGATNELKQRMK